MAGLEWGSADQRSTLVSKAGGFRRRLARADGRERPAVPLRGLSPQKRRAYEEVLSLVYECFGDRRGAKDLVDRMLARIKT
jgi:hypothetical protein